MNLVKRYLDNNDKIKIGDWVTLKYVPITIANEAFKRVRYRVVNVTPNTNRSIPCHDCLSKNGEYYVWIRVMYSNRDGNHMTDYPICICNLQKQKAPDKIYFWKLKLRAFYKKYEVNIITFPTCLSPLTMRKWYGWLISIGLFVFVLAVMKTIKRYVGPTPSQERRFYN